jgi:hypothetical protein
MTLDTSAEYKPFHLDFEQRYSRPVVTIRAMTGGAGYAQGHLEQM